MHMVVKVLVYADDEEEAVELAGSILDGMCGEAFFPFDYYNTFDKGWATERWGELPKAVKICGEFGNSGQPSVIPVLKDLSASLLK